MMHKLKPVIKLLLPAILFSLLVQCASVHRRPVVVNRPLPPLNRACLHFIAEGNTKVFDGTFEKIIQSGLKKEAGVEIPLCKDGKNEGGSVIQITHKIELASKIITKVYGSMYEYVFGTKVNYSLVWIDGNDDALSYTNLSISKTKEVAPLKYDVEMAVPVVVRAADSLKHLLLAVIRPNDGFRGTWRSLSGEEEYQIVYNSETARFEGIQKKPDDQSANAVVFWFTLDADQKDEKDGEEAWGGWIVRKETKNSTKENPEFDTEEINATLTLEGQLLTVDVRGPFAVPFLYDRDLIKVKDK